MALTQQECASRLAEMSREEQACFLSLLGHNLTVVGRDAYELQGTGVKNPQMLRDLNEIHHRLYAQLMSLTWNETLALPTDALAACITAKDKPTLRTMCLHAFETSLIRMQNRH